jgi:hypothetical protein
LGAQSSLADGTTVAFIYAGAAIALAVIAVLSRRGPYVRAAVPAAMRALGRQFAFHR